MFCFLLFAILLEQLVAKCPNSCSGHGICGVANQCSCYSGWNGGAADCSFRTCPTGTAWADKAYATDSAHQPAECSNAGECDRSTGMCKCFPGFTGSACQRLSCPMDCSGHGVCSTLRDISLFDGPDYDSRIDQAGDGIGIPYLNWDSDSIQMCECDSGYFGADCSLSMCPKGDDPLTINQNIRSIQLDVFSGGPFRGEIGLEFQGTTIYIPFLGISSQSCTELLSFNGKFGLVECTYTEHLGYHFSLDLIFFNWPVFPKDNNLYSNNGNPSIYDFYCDVTYANPSTYCSFSDIQANDIIEYAYCSNRGNCDYRTGTCSCYDGFGGPACSNSTYLYEAESVGSPGLLVNSNALNFSSSVLQIQAAKAPASDFYLIEATANSQTMFYVRGDGVVGIDKLKTLSGGQTVSGGGLYIEEGGCTIADTGLNVYSSNPTNSVLQIGSKYSGPLSSSYSALQISSASTYSNNFYAINTVNQGKNKFSVRGDGAVFVRGGGVQVTSGITILSDGLSVTGGITLNDVGFVIMQSGLSVTGGLTINSNGMKVSNGGLQVYGGSSIYSGGLKVAGGMTISSGGLTITSGLSINNNGITVSGGLSILNGGCLVTGGVTVSNLGLVISVGGITVNSGGAFVTGGLSVGAGLAVTGGIRNTGGLTVGTSLYASNSAVTISNGGLVINGGGFSVTSGAVSFNSGVSIDSGGIVIATGGLTVTSGLVQAGTGMQVTGGLSIFTNGLYSSSGATITGNTFLSGLTVAGQSFFTSGSVSFGSGVVISGGLTVIGTTELQYSPVTYSLSDRRLKTNLSPISDALIKVSKLKGLYYDWVQNEPSGMVLDKKRHLGVIAQEVQKILPEVVQRSRDSDYLTVDYTSFVPLLVEAIKDLEDLIKNLAVEVTRLKKEIS